MFAATQLMLKDERLRGRTVLSSDGLALGEVTYFMIDPEGWRVAAIGVRLRRDAADRIGMPHGFFRAHTIEIPTEQVQSSGDAVILSVPAASLRVSDQATAPAAEAHP